MLSSTANNAPVADAFEGAVLSANERGEYYFELCSCAIPPLLPSLLIHIPEIYLIYAAENGVIRCVI